MAPPRTPPRSSSLPQSLNKHLSSSNSSNGGSSDLQPTTPLRTSRPRTIMANGSDGLYQVPNSRASLAIITTPSKRDYQREIIFQGHARRREREAAAAMTTSSSPTSRRCPSPSNFPTAPSPCTSSLPSSPQLPGSPDSLLSIPNAPSSIGRSSSGHSIPIFLDGEREEKSDFGVGSTGLGLGFVDQFMEDVELDCCASPTLLQTSSISFEPPNLSPPSPSRSSSTSSASLSLSGSSWDYNHHSRATSITERSSICTSAATEETSSLAPPSQSSLSLLRTSRIQEQDKLAMQQYLEAEVARHIRNEVELSPLEEFQRQRIAEVTMMKSLSSKTYVNEDIVEDQDDEESKVTSAYVAERQSALFGTSYSVAANLSIHSASLITPTPRSRPGTSNSQKVLPSTPLSSTQNLPRSKSLSPTTKQRLLLHTASSASAGYHRIISDENNFSSTTLPTPTQHPTQPRHAHSYSQSTTSTTLSNSNTQKPLPDIPDYRTQTLDLQIDQEGFRAVSCSFKFQKEEGDVLEFVATPSASTSSSASSDDGQHDLLPGYPFHYSAFERHPVLRRLHIGGDCETDYLPRQSYLTVGKKNGIYKAAGGSKKGTLRYCLMYEVTERMSLNDKLIAGEKILRPLLFICTRNLLNPARAKKVGFVSLLVKALATPSTATLYRAVSRASAPEDEGELLSL